MRARARTIPVGSRYRVVKKLEEHDEIGSPSFIHDFRESSWNIARITLADSFQLYKYSAHKYVYIVNRLCAKTAGSVSKNGTKG